MNQRDTAITNLTMGLRSTLEAFAGRKILLLGDLVADHYIRGRSSRISREAPVLILKYQDESVIPGQVGNTASNIAALGGSAHLIGVIGNDARGGQLFDALKAAGIRLDGIVRSEQGATLTKTRILAGGHHAARQQVIRIDDDERLMLDDVDKEAVLVQMKSAADWAEAIIVSDYGYGVVNDDTWALAREIAEQRNIPLILDSRYELARWKGATLITPNVEEALNTTGANLEADYDIIEVGLKLREITQCKHLVITRGNEGMSLFEDGLPPQHLPIFGSREVTDVTGAGDTVVATASLTLAAGRSPETGMILSNLAGSLVVMKLGTATVTCEEMLTSLDTIPLEILEKTYAHQS